MFRQVCWVYRRIFYTEVETIIMFYNCISWSVSGVYIYSGRVPSSSQHSQVVQVVLICIIECAKRFISSKMSSFFQIIKKPIFTRDINKFLCVLPIKIHKKYRQMSKRCVWCLKLCWNSLNSTGPKGRWTVARRNFSTTFGSSLMPFQSITLIGYYHLKNNHVS